MFDFYTFTYILSLIIALSTLIIATYAALCRPFTLRIFPKALRLYVIVCYIPFIFLISISTSIYAIIYLIFETQNLYIIDFLNTVNSYLSQIVRTFFFTITIERIIATIYLEKYTLAHKAWFVWILALFSFLITMGFVIFLFNVTNDRNLTFLLYTYSIFGVHIASTVAFGILFHLNKRLFKITAYRISLQKRYQILENLKILRFLFRSIVIYSVFAPMGSTIIVIGLFTKIPPLPNCIFHIFHNLPNLIICLRLLLINSKNSKHLRQIGVKSVMGKNLPVMYASDKYFEGLRKQWK